MAREQVEAGEGVWGHDWSGPALLSGRGLHRCVETWQRRADAVGPLQAQGSRDVDMS